MKYSNFTKPDGKTTAIWTANISPGFVNGVDPLYKPTNQGLCDNPDIPIYEVQAVSKIPPFFVQLGAVPTNESTLNTSGAALGNLSLTTDRPIVASGCCPGTAGKLLMSCQIWVMQARATFSVAVDIPANLVTGDLVDYTVTYNTKSVDTFGSRVRLMTGAFMPDKKTATLEERVAGAYGDDGTDSFLIATVYFLSLNQDDEHFSANLDDSWMPFVKHNCFWNLGYQVPNIVPFNLQQNKLDPFLAWFIGRYTFAAGVYGAAQSAEQAIIDAVSNDNANAGSFYTI